MQIATDPQVLKALQHAEAVLSAAPEFSTNKNGKGPNTCTSLALKLVRDAMSAANGGPHA